MGAFKQGRAKVAQLGSGLSLFFWGFNGGSACAISVSRLQLRVNPKSMAMRRGVRATRPVAPTSGTTGCLLSVFVYRLDYDLTKCQTKALRVPFLAPKYSLVDFVAFSGDSQNTHCCCVGNFSSFLRRLPAEAPFLVVPPSWIPLFLLPSDLLIRHTFWRVKLTSFYFHFPKIWLPGTKQSCLGGETILFGAANYIVWRAKQYCSGHVLSVFRKWNV